MGTESTQHRDYSAKGPVQAARPHPGPRAPGRKVGAGLNAEPSARAGVIWRSHTKPCHPGKTTASGRSQGCPAPGPGGWHSTASDPRNLPDSQPGRRGHCRLRPHLPSPPCPRVPLALTSASPGRCAAGGPASGEAAPYPPLRGPPRGRLLPASGQQGPRWEGREQEASRPGREASPAPSQTEEVWAGAARALPPGTWAAHDRVGEADTGQRGWRVKAGGWPAAGRA